MAVQLINVGNIANDGTGDDLREAMIKINQNFEELDLRDDEQTSAVNLGTGAEVFSQKINYELQFKTLTAGTDVSILERDEDLVISAAGGLKTLVFNADTGIISLDQNDSVTFAGGNKISTTISDHTITVSYTGWEQLADDPNPQLSGPLIANNQPILGASLLQAGDILSNNIAGNLTGLVYNIDIRNLNRYFDQYWDFGVLGDNITSSIQWIVSSVDVDLGTIVNPELRNIEFGAFI